MKKKLKSAIAASAIALVVGFSSTACTSTKRGDFGLGSHGENFSLTGQVYEGKASWYSVRTNGGTRTASGEPFRNNGATAAHRSLPFGTYVRVTNLRNNLSEVVRITDRGPYIRGRIIDVSIGTAEKLGFVKAGVIPVRVEVLGRD